MPSSDGAAGPPELGGGGDRGPSLPCQGDLHAPGMIIMSSLILGHLETSAKVTPQCLGEEYGETTLYLAITLAILVTTCVLQVRHLKDMER